MLVASSVRVGVASSVALIAGPSVVTRAVFSSRIYTGHAVYTEIRLYLYERTGWTHRMHTDFRPVVSSCPSHEPVRIDTQGPCLPAVQKNWLIRTERISLLNGCAFSSTATRGQDHGDGFGPLVLRGEAVRWPNQIARQADFAHFIFCVGCVG